MGAPNCPEVTVDAVVFDNQHRLLVIKRRNEPFKDQWALPGGFVDVTDQNVEAAVIRELLEETALPLTDGQLYLLKVYSDLGRDPRGPTISIAFAGILNNPLMGERVAAGDDAKEVAWINDWRLQKLAFDHGRIVRDAWDAFQVQRPGPHYESNLDPQLRALTTKQRYHLKRIYQGNPVEWDQSYASLLRRGLICSTLLPTGQVIYTVTTRGIVALS